MHYLAPSVRFERTAAELTALSSTTELRGNKLYYKLERMSGIKPDSTAWKAGAQSIYHTRIKTF